MVRGKSNSFSCDPVAGLPGVVGEHRKEDEDEGKEKEEAVFNLPECLRAFRNNLDWLGRGSLFRNHETISPSLIHGGRGSKARSRYVCRT